MLRIETDMKQSEVDQESFDHRKALSDAINEEEEQQRQPRTAHAAANSAQSSQRNAMCDVSSPKRKPKGQIELEKRLNEIKVQKEKLQEKSKSMSINKALSNLDN